MSRASFALLLDATRQHCAETPYDVLLELPDINAICREMSRPSGCQLLQSLVIR